jgi:hypothetical protein
MIIDGVNKLWIVRTLGALKIDGHKTDIEAIGSLIRHALTFSKDPDIRTRIESVVAEAMKHTDESAEEETPTSEDC